MTALRADPEWSLAAAADKFQIKTLGTAFAIAGLVVGMIIVVTSVRTVRDVSRVGEVWSDFESGPAAKYVHVNQLRGAIGYGGMIHEFKNYILRRDRPRLVRIQEKIRDVIVYVTAYRAVGVTARESEALEVIERVVNEYYRMVSIAERMVAEGVSAREIDRVVEVRDAEAWAALTVLDEEIEAAREANSQAIGRLVGSTQTFVTWATIIESTLLVSLAVGVFWFTGIHLARPLRDLVQVVNRLAAGDSSVEVPGRERTDEIGDMTRALQVFKSNSIELSERTRLLAHAQRLARVGNWRRDVRTEKVEWSEEMFRLCGVEPQEPSLELFRSTVHPYDRAALLQANQHAIETGDPFSIDFRVVHQGGMVRVIHTEAEVIKEGGQSVYLVGTCQDITESDEARVQVEASLNEKVLLLKEVHHRVKNNLQVISSLLTLQANASESEEVGDALRESQRRVMAMATVHKTLYGHESLSELDCKQYVESLTTELLKIYRSNVSFDVNVSGFLAIDRAVPMGLIINELVSNAFEHAFPSGQSGTITILLAPRNRDRLFLRISDDGVGFPDQVETKSGDNVGWSLVRMLVEQLEGELDLKQDDGTCVEITFPA